jgi:hypothetical protein
MTNVNLSKLREELLDTLSGYAKDFAIKCEDNFDNHVSGQEYISDLISEFSDEWTDVYYSDLKQWAMNHIDDLEAVIDEGYYDPSHKYSLFNHIQAAQYMSIEHEINDNLSDIIRYLAISYLWRVSEKDMTEDEVAGLEDYLDPCAMNTFDEIKESVDNFIEAV